MQTHRTGEYNMFSTAAAIAVTIGSIGTLGVTTDNPISRQLNKWLQFYSKEDQEKIHAIARIFRTYIMYLLHSIG